MLKLHCFIILLCCFFIETNSQNILTGTVLDSKTEETLIGANIVLINNTTANI